MNLLELAMKSSSRHYKEKIKSERQGGEQEEEEEEQEEE